MIRLFFLISCVPPFSQNCRKQHYSKQDAGGIYENITNSRRSTVNNALMQFIGYRIQNAAQERDPLFIANSFYTADCFQMQHKSSTENGVFRKVSKLTDHKRPEIQDLSLSVRWKSIQARIEDFNNTLHDRTAGYIGFICCLRREGIDHRHDRQHG